jgi:hypothetical protein
LPPSCSPGRDEARHRNARPADDVAERARKLRNLELKAGLPSQRGQRGRAQAYNLSTTRAAERQRAAEGEANVHAKCKEAAWNDDYMFQLLAG